IAVGAAGFSSAAGCWVSWAQDEWGPSASAIQANAVAETVIFLTYFMSLKASRAITFFTVHQKQATYHSGLSTECTGSTANRTVVRQSTSSRSRPNPESLSRFAHLTREVDYSLGSNPAWRWRNRQRRHKHEAVTDLQAKALANRPGWPF